MKAEAMSFTFLGTEGQVKIPFFQRGYVWNIENWEDILDDLLDFKKSHFLGSLILKQLEPQTGKTKEVLVIDGQQRLTTLSILVRTYSIVLIQIYKITANHLFTAIYSIREIKLTKNSLLKYCIQKLMENTFNK